MIKYIKPLKRIGPYGLMCLATFGSNTAQAGYGSIWQRSYMSASHFKIESQDYSAIEVTFTGEFNEKLALRYGMVFYDGMPVKHGRDDFVGATAALYYHFDKSFLNPYIGLGISGASSNNCSDYGENMYDCKENGLVSVYPEVGLTIYLSKFVIYPYVRRSFSTNNNGEEANAAGLALGYQF